jgi:hypothetical protein
MADRYAGIDWAADKHDVLVADEMGTEVLACRVVWQCWRNHTPYDPARHRALQRHLTVTIPSSSGPVPDLAATQRMAGAAVTPRAAAGRARSA